MQQILLVEDDPSLGTILNVALQFVERELEIIHITDSDEAIAYIDANVYHIALFILDIRLPGQATGLDVARYARDLNSTAPIIVTSAFNNPTFAVLQEIQAQWIPKPWDMETFIADVLRLLM